MSDPSRERLTLAAVAIAAMLAVLVALCLLLAEPAHGAQGICCCQYWVSTQRFWYQTPCELTAPKCNAPNETIRPGCGDIPPDWVPGGTSTPGPTPTAAPIPGATPTPTPQATPSPSPTPASTPTPTATPTATPAPTPATLGEPVRVLAVPLALLLAQVTVEITGVCGEYACRSWCGGEVLTWSAHQTWRAPATVQAVACVGCDSLTGRYVEGGSWHPLPASVAVWP